ncbi:MAG: phosphoenolpyruvate carboxykinase [Synergistetes bacterium ADurb.BinA166]|nr:MAG: phosphoenolpyruvate carboxykinase [Synergistetes bacterium ADurb.BinA166]
MSTVEFYTDPASFSQIKSQARTTIESAFYGNNVVPVTGLEQAYELARRSPGTVEMTGMPVHRPVEQGLPAGANVLLMNDGTVVGRCAAARKIVGEPGVNMADLAPLLREAVYGARFRTFYSAEAYIGLQEDFMVKAHLMVPKDFENLVYNWLLNFQYMNEDYDRMYASSRRMDDGDIFVFADPDWSSPDYPYGLAFFDPLHNCAAVLGMRYFGELKKGTLTLAWGIAARNGYASCHGGLKRYNLQGGRSFVAAVFGLSGSGKSTITHARHGDKYDVTVLHDDAFVIQTKEKYSIALEPSYFDKVQDYPMGCDDNRFIISLQNCGVTRGADGLLQAVTEDLRNGNGRAIKSKFWSPRRVDRIDEPIDAIFWLMKDSSLPPVVKLKDPDLAAVLGATLATKRTSAERLASGVDPNALVIESYANPFRTYPLSVDYERFRSLFEDGVACYILNTGDFMGRKVKPADTLGIVESIVEGTAEFAPLLAFGDMETIDLPSFPIDRDDEHYRRELLSRLRDRLSFVVSRATEKGGLDKLPPEAEAALRKAIGGIEAV